VEYLERLGAKVIMWKTGHSLIKAKMKEVNAPIAGEMSGHIFFKHRFFGHDDAIYASLRFLEMLSQEEKSLTELLAEIPRYVSTPEIRVPVTNDEVKFRIVAELVEKFKAMGLPVIDIDGARIEFPDGFALVRASNTQSGAKPTEGVLRIGNLNMARVKKAKRDTPLLEQYKRIKAEHPEEILLFHLGDFYETFFEDAETVSRVLGIVLTSRPMGKGIRVPMAGIPVRAAESYINRLLKAGYKVAQTDEKEGRTLLKRVVTEVITPGTVLSEGILPEDANNYLVAYVSALGEAGAALVDVSTGDVLYIHGKEEEVREELERLNVGEMILPKGKKPPVEVKAITERDRGVFSSQMGMELLKETYGETYDLPPLVLSAFSALALWTSSATGHYTPF